MATLNHRLNEPSEFKGVMMKGRGPSGCTACGWRGIPTLINGEVQDDCPACTITNDDYLAMLKPPPPKQGRNEPCLCGSGKKFKRCCGA